MKVFQFFHDILTPQPPRQRNGEGVKIAVRRREVIELLSWIYFCVSVVPIPYLRTA